jgi:branched-chain amino acid transport system ATP-binding protein
MVEDRLLVARDIVAGYPGKRILHGVSFFVRKGEVVALLGANGSGKSTAMNAISGFVRVSEGRITLAGRNITNLPPHKIFRLGVAQVSQSRDLFPDMTVEDNLRLGASRRNVDEAALLDSVLQRFPRLRERRGQPVRQMSGGEQQMVAIGRALMSDPVLLLLDEPSGGLAPKFVIEIGEILKATKATGMTILMVEQNIKLALKVADRFLVLKSGLVAERGDLSSGVSPEAIARDIYL